MMLFVCSQGKIRSRTAEVLCLIGGIDARSCGTDEDAIVPISDHLIRCADVIICMEDHHISTLRKMDFMHMDGKELIVLGIEDIYKPFDPLLVKNLIESLNIKCPVASAAIMRGEACRQDAWTIELKKL